jgi:hypothetical protein
VKIKFQIGILVLALLSVFSLQSCKEEDEKLKEDFSNVNGSYFSVRQFALDQWNTFYGEPFLIVKSVRVNDGRYDSSYTTSDTLNWGKIFKVFFATDISDRKFLGKYKYTQFEDAQDETLNLFYEALDDDLYTRKLLITADQYNHKVRGIYIEAVENSVGDAKIMKLYYKPMKRIQIQETESPMMGEKKHTVTEYEFIR